MIFWCHLLYTIAFVAYVISVNAPTLEEYVQLSARKQRRYRRAPYVCMVFYYVFVLMNLLIQTRKPGAFEGELGHQLLSATFGVVMLWAGIKERKLLPKKFVWILPVLYFFYTLKRNWAVMKSIFYILDFLLAEAGSVIMLIIFCVMPHMIMDQITPRTAAEEAESQRIAEEIQAQYEAERQRKRQEEERKLQERIYSYSSQSSSSDDDRESYTDRYLRNMEEKGKANLYVSSSRNCTSCDYYDSGRCRHSASQYYDRDIWSPGSTNCGHYVRK